MSCYNVYHWCLVFGCNNTSVKTPQKLWIQVPFDIKMRNTWLKLARRDPKSLSAKTRLYFCEDHFDLENDMENYTQYKVMGSVKRIRMKPNCVPSRFDCQADRKPKSTPSEPRHAFIKRQRMSTIKEIEETILNENCIISLPSCSQDSAKGLEPLPLRAVAERPRGTMSMESCVTVKEEPRSSFTIDVCIKKETEWGEGAEEELGPAGELGCLQSDHAGTLHDVKAEPSGYEIASSGDCSEAARLGGLYTDHVVKDELVLGPECIQKPHVAAVPRERNPLESSAVSGRPPAVGQPAVRECSVRLERVAVPPSLGPPSLSVPPAPAPSSPGPRRSRRPRAPARAASPAAFRSKRAVHTTVVYKNKKNQICLLCGRKYVHKWNLKTHVKRHIHGGPWICTRTRRDSVLDSDEEVDVVSLDSPGPLLAATLLRTNMNCK